MGDEPIHDVWSVDETYDLGPEPDSPAELTVTTTFGAWRADGIRRSLASDSAALSRGYVEYYGRHYSDAVELEPLKVEDDLAANRLRITERYRLARVWTPAPDNGDVEFGLIDDLFSQHLTTAPQGRRRWTIDLGLPRRASWTSTIKLPLGVNVQGWDREYGMPGVRVASRHEQLDTQGREIRLHRSIEVEPQFLPPDLADQYFGMRESALRTAGLIVTVAVEDGRFVSGSRASPPGPSKTPWWRTVGIWSWRGFWLLIAALLVFNAFTQVILRPILAHPPS